MFVSKLMKYATAHGGHVQVEDLELALACQGLEYKEGKIIGGRKEPPYSFNSADSELMGETIIVPEGMTASIDGNVITLKKKSPDVTTVVVDGREIEKHSISMQVILDEVEKITKECFEELNERIAPIDNECYRWMTNRIMNAASAKMVEGINAEKMAEEHVDTTMIIDSMNCEEAYDLFRSIRDFAFTTYQQGVEDTLEKIKGDVL